MSSMDARIVAFTPLGNSEAIAVIAAAIFFIAGVISIANLLYTNTSDRLLSNDSASLEVLQDTHVRSISYSCRAAYLGGACRPALQGVFLAFVISGYGASVVTLCLTHAWWYNHKPAIVFTAWIDFLMKKFSMVLAVVCLCSGPIIGVLAAGFIYGANDDPVLGQTGIQLRIAASYGILGSNIAIFIMVGASTIRAFVCPGPLLGELQERKQHTKKNPRLHACSGSIPAYFCYCFVERCCLGGATGIATLYESKSYLWQNDKSFYPLDTLPEVLSFIIICWPAALARIAMFWPSKDRTADEESSPPSKAAAGPREQGNGSAHAPNGLA